jgi:hypothetical protein
MDGTEDPYRDASLPPSLRFLKWLVIALMVVMIAGVITITALLVTRLQPAVSPLPASIDLPDDAFVTAVTAGPGWYAVVTQDSRILIYDATTGALRQTVTVD